MSYVLSFFLVLYLSNSNELNGLCWSTYSLSGL